MRFGISDFFRDVTGFLKYRRVLGVDIGTVAIKMVELERQKDDVVLSNYAILEKKDYLDRANDAIQTTSLKLSPMETAAMLKLMVREMQPQTDRVVASVPLFGVFVAPIEMPVMTNEETQRSILFQARQYIPIPPSEMTLDWVKVEEFQNAQGQRFQRVLLTGIPNELVEKYKQIFKLAGLHLMALEVESQALIRGIAHGEKDPTLLIDIGAESTGFAVMEGGALKQVSQSDYAGAALTQALARSLDMSPWRAEELKKRRGLQGTGSEAELSTSLEPFLDVIIQEGDRVRGVFTRATGRTIGKVMLVGGGANLPGISEYVKNRMQVTVLYPRPFAQIEYSNQLEPTIRGLSTTLALSAGLALKFYGSTTSTTVHKSV